ncbi:TIGR00296 family protein [Candidatus Woesearchaeota archaeon]|nr:TIGR00296 family protein [Candidatus Woesearchaeota archaeon]MBW3022006.1 TIGR00296 family protein [Candidatus Woesearchaeota archaeon]
MNGQKLVKAARDAIGSRFGKGFKLSEEFKQEFKDKRGCFVTLTIKGELRGCIGYPEPTVPLYEAVIESAKNAAFSDPRFPQLSEEEFRHVKIEVTVLTKPELIKVKQPEDYIREIVVGRDGLIVERGYKRGLLLPQVPVEWEWDVKEFLEQTCAKAGLSIDAWMELDTKVYKFQGEIFSE